jgi:hypothetical protein
MPSPGAPYGFCPPGPRAGPLPSPGLAPAWSCWSGGWHLTQYQHSFNSHETMKLTKKAIVSSGTLQGEAVDQCEIGTPPWPPAPQPDAPAAPGVLEQSAAASIRRGAGNGGVVGSPPSIDSALRSPVPQIRYRGLRYAGSVRGSSAGRYRRHPGRC